MRDIVCHVLGEAEAFASMREFVRQFRISSREARSTGAEQIDAMNDLQVRERSHLAPHELVTRLETVAPRSVKQRRRTPRLMRAMHMKLPVVGKGSYGYLSDAIINRDVWMHRNDIARAAGKELQLTAGYDARLVADVLPIGGGATDIPSCSSSKARPAAHTCKTVVSQRSIVSTPLSSVASFPGGRRAPAS